MKNVLIKIARYSSFVIMLIFISSLQVHAQRFRGNIEYYSSVFPSEDGKIKSIGDVRVAYYNSVFPDEDGKLKTIGNIRFEYFNATASKSKGKIKSIQNEGDDPASDDALNTYYFIEKLNRQ